jgi:hypothetical protein
MPFKFCQHRDETCTFEATTSGPKRSDLTMRTSSISRSKIFTTEPLADSRPDIPILETEDLPSEADWAFLKSLCFDQADVCDVDPDIDQLIHSTIERADFN